ncbi:fumarate reductase subunit C [Mergibacter septicus]|uniref:Fumarate reductase subunit C n=1 Tax=Mergibacter septicus TaxID=221402 RepID=A0A8E3MEY7_9PAST|nr:fumarate reductase subunit FrdC [Mergibacter septicus]AWX14753.1 fumarate reductase subunit C [Mergibacter septicus]QDJ14004.1 fumarate reductase subunit C [Mergibacter septicus]UTU48547.1 fumarate reductase subunit FrdC [Mergibacter septicus]WMR95824.1 fumarate reductase subunit FrdC [Mergibacter septicus]
MSVVNHSSSSKRKKYVREVKASWWKKLDFYKAYMLREATAIPTVWFCIVLLFGVINLNTNGLEGIVTFISFLRNPIVIILNIITLGMVCYNTYTWFNLTPKALNIIYNNERLPQSYIRVVMWVITVAVTLLTLVLIYL